MSNITVEDLTKNSDFNALLSVGVTLMSAQAKTVESMSPKQRKAQQQKLKRIRSKLKGHHQFSEAEVAKGLPPTVAATLGVSSDQLEDLARKAQRHAGAFITAVPEFQDLEASAKVDLLMAAVKQNPDVAAFIARRTASDTTACQQNCAAIAALLYVVAFVGWIVEVALCSPLVFIPPLFLLCFAWVTAQLAWEMKQIQDWFEDCKEDCFSDPDGS